MRRLTICGFITTTLPAVTLLVGCGGDGKSTRVKLTENLSCSTSYEAKSTDALGVEETGMCAFRGSEITIVTFMDNGSRNNYICSTCGFGSETDARTIQATAHRLGGNFVAGDRYLVRVPNSQAEQAVKETLGAPDVSDQP